MENLENSEEVNEKIEEAVKIMKKFFPNKPAKFYIAYPFNKIFFESLFIGMLKNTETVLFSVFFFTLYSQ